MHRWAVLVLAAAGMPCHGAAQSATEILEKVSAAYSGGTPLDIEFIDRLESHSQSSQTTSERPTRIAQSGHKTRQEGGGMLTLSDGIHNWQYRAGSHEYTQREGWLSSRFDSYARIAERLRAGRILREDTLTLQGVAVPCYVIEVDREPRAASGVAVTGKPETFWIDTKRFLVLKSLTSTSFQAPGSEANENVHVVQVTRAAAGGQLADSLFEFNPPAGAVRVDRISARPASPLLGKAFPDFECKDPEGKPASVKAQADTKLTILRFGQASDKTNAAYVELLYRAFQEKGLAVWNVIADRSGGSQGVRQGSGYTMPTVIAAPSATPAALGFTSGALMGVVVLDPAGKVVYHSNGLNGTALQSDIFDLLHDAGIR